METIVLLQIGEVVTTLLLAVAVGCLVGELAVQALEWDIKRRSAKRSQKRNDKEGNDEA